MMTYKSNHFPLNAPFPLFFHHCPPSLPCCASVAHVGANNGQTGDPGLRPAPFHCGQPTTPPTISRTGGHPPPCPQSKQGAAPLQRNSHTPQSPGLGCAHARPPAQPVQGGHTSLICIWTVRLVAQHCTPFRLQAHNAGAGSTRGSTKTTVCPPPLAQRADWSHGTGLPDGPPAGPAGCPAPGPAADRSAAWQTDWSHSVRWALAIKPPPLDVTRPSHHSPLCALVYAYPVRRLGQCTGAKISFLGCWRGEGGGGACTPQGTGPGGQQG